jgi:hypothetical protein
VTLILAVIRHPEGIGGAFQPPLYRLADRLRKFVKPDPPSAGDAATGLTHAEPERVA